MKWIIILTELYLTCMYKIPIFLKYSSINTYTYPPPHYYRWNAIRREDIAYSSIFSFITATNQSNTIHKLFSTHPKGNWNSITINTRAVGPDTWFFHLIFCKSLFPNCVLYEGSDRRVTSRFPVSWWEWLADTLVKPPPRVLQKLPDGKGYDAVRQRKSTD